MGFWGFGVLGFWGFGGVCVHVCVSVCVCVCVCLKENGGDMEVV